jgi:hypothetical protein
MWRALADVRSYRRKRTGKGKRKQARPPRPAMVNGGSIGNGKRG